MRVSSESLVLLVLAFRLFVLRLRLFPAVDVLSLTLIVTLGIPLVIEMPRGILEVVLVYGKIRSDK